MAHGKPQTSAIDISKSDNIIIKETNTVYISFQCETYNVAAPDCFYHAAIHIWFLCTESTRDFTSVVTTIELSPPLRWLATTEPTLPLRCFTVFLAVFLGALFPENCPSLFRRAAIVI